MSFTLLSNAECDWYAAFRRAGISCIAVRIVEDSAINLGHINVETGFGNLNTW